MTLLGQQSKEKSWSAVLAVRNQQKSEVGGKQDRTSEEWASHLLEYHLQVTAVFRPV